MFLPTFPNGSLNLSKTHHLSSQASFGSYDLVFPLCQAPRTALWRSNWVPVPRPAPRGTTFRQLRVLVVRAARNSNAPGRRPLEIPTTVPGPVDLNRLIGVVFWWADFQENPGFSTFAMDGCCSSMIIYIHVAASQENILRWYIRVGIRPTTTSPPPSPH